MNFDIDFKKLLKLAKTLPLVLRILAAIVAVDLLIMLFAWLSLADDVDARAFEATQAEDKLKELSQKIRSTRAEIDRLPDLRKQYDKAVKGDVLAEQDRVKFIDLAKKLAIERRLQDFHFKLAPEKLESLQGTTLQLVSTDVELSNGGLFDNDVFAFWDQFLVDSQAHYEIARAQIDFETTTSVAKAPQMIHDGQSPILVRATIAFHWESMRKLPGAEKTAESAKPPAVPEKQNP